MATEAMRMDEAIQGEWVGQEGQRAEPGTPGNTKAWKKGVGLAKVTEESWKEDKEIMLIPKPRENIWKKELLNNIKCGREVR